MWELFGPMTVPLALAGLALLLLVVGLLGHVVGLWSLNDAPSPRAERERATAPAAPPSRVVATRTDREEAA